MRYRDDLEVDREEPGSYGERALVARKYRKRLALAKIAAREFFRGKDRDALAVLLMSATPVDDLGGMFGSHQSAAYKKARGLGRQLAEYVAWLEKRTYREAERALLASMPEDHYWALWVWLRCRNEREVAVTIKRAERTVRGWLAKVDEVMQRLRRSTAVRDVFVLVRRLRKVRRSKYERRRG